MYELLGWFVNCDLEVMEILYEYFVLYVWLVEFVEKIWLILRFVCML